MKRRHRKKFLKEMKRILGALEDINEILSNTLYGKERPAEEHEALLDLDLYPDQTTLDGIGVLVERIADVADAMEGRAEREEKR